MAHKGAQSCNLFINEICHLATTTQQAGSSINAGPPNTHNMHALPHSDLNVRHFKVGAKSSAWFRVSCSCPQAALGSFVSFLVVYILCTWACHVCCRETNHMQVWKVNLFAFSSNSASCCLPVSDVSRCLQLTWVSGDQASVQVPSIFAPFYFSCLQVMSCMLG